MPVRTRLILVGAGAVVIALLWFLFVWRPSQSRIGELRAQQEAARTERAQLEGQLQRLRQLQQDEPRLRAELARLDDALPLEARIPDFILQMHETANLAGVSFFSLGPSLPGPFTPAAPPAGAPPAQITGTPGPLQSISVSISTRGTFFALEDLIVRLERLPRAVRINSFSLGGRDPVTGEMAVGFAMQMFVSGAAAAPGAPAPAPAATPAPGATPATTPGG